jgi:hypothetical protein
VGWVAGIPRFQPALKDRVTKSMIIGIVASAFSMALFAADVGVPGIPAQSTNAYHAIFESAFMATGDQFVSFEQQLATNSLALSVVKAKQEHPDPVARLFARYLLVWQTNGGKEFLEAMEYIDKKAERVRPTPAMYPRSDGMANTLSETYDGRVAAFLATRLITSSNWPHWKAAAVILYLGQQRIPSTTEALIRFAAEARSKELREVTVGSIRQMRDAELPSKLRAEQARLWSRRHEEFPSELLKLQSEKKNNK